MVCNGLYEALTAGLLEYLPSFVGDEEKLEQLKNYLKQLFNTDKISVYTSTETTLQMRIDEMIFTLQKTLKFGEETNIELSFETAIFEVEQAVFDAKVIQIEDALRTFAKKNAIVDKVLSKKFKQKGFRKVGKPTKDKGWRIKQWRMSKQLERSLK